MAEAMRAAVLHAPGDLRVERVPKPEPGPGEVLVRVDACGVCGSDIPRVMETGTYQMPMIPGHEFAGEVAEVGPEVNNVSVGDRITTPPLIPCLQCDYCAIGEYTMCEQYSYYGSRCDGAFAEYVKIWARHRLALPDELDSEDAATADPAAVALHGLRRADLQPGEMVVVLGAGPIGLFAAQWAKILGAGRTAVVDIFTEKLEIARKVGVDICIDGKSEDPEARIKDETEGKGADIALETAGSPVTQELALRVIRKFGRIVYIGSATGDVNLPKASFELILRRQLTVRGSWNSNFAPIPINEWQETIDRLASGELRAKPLISHRFPLDQAPQAFQMMYGRKAFFSKVMIIP